MCVESVYVVGRCTVVTIEHGRYSLSGMQKLWACSQYGMLGALSYVVKSSLLLLNVAESDMDCLLCGKLWNEQSWQLCSFSECVESLVHSWQNGTRCMDDVNVLWCHSYLVWLVFEGSISTVLVFIQKAFGDLFLLLFFNCFLEIAREKRIRQGKMHGL